MLREGSKFPYFAKNGKCGPSIESRSFASLRMTAYKRMPGRGAEVPSLRDSYTSVLATRHCRAGLQIVASCGLRGFAEAMHECVGSHQSHSFQTKECVGHGQLNSHS